ncbi:MAG: hypothetical protein P1U56_15625 [Saprospiraceae bacterium]|nr:hypothetical protein [Saprospiraceae bacterium]
MFKQLNLTEFIPQSIRCIKIMVESYDFFKKHKLWKGIFEHKWIVLLTVLISVIFTYTIATNLVDYFSPASEILNADGDPTNARQDSKETAIFGGSKFLMMIMLEVVIFHFSVRTLEALNKEKYTTTFGMFFKAEIRMIKVMIRGFVYSLIIQFVLTIILKIADLEYLLPFLIFIVHAYIIGYAFFDNYNEQQKLNIKESDLCIRYNSGAATTLGIVASLGLMVPIIGPIVVPIFGAIASNIYGFKYHIENPPEHVIPKAKTEVEEFV